MDELVELVLGRLREQYLDRLAPATSHDEAARVRVSARLVRATLLAFADVLEHVSDPLPREIYSAAEHMELDYRRHLKRGLG